MGVNNEERRKISNEKIKALGIACLEELPLVEDSTAVKLKSLDDICKRAIACIISIQVACDIDGGHDYEESKSFFVPMLEKFGVQDELLPKEKSIFEGNYTKQNVIDVTWTYELYWVLVWALGLVDELNFPKDICDVKAATEMVSLCNSYEEFKGKCKLRDIEEILDELDLYYRYHWACDEKRINPETSIGDLNSDVVIERRRGLEWLVSNEKDWNEISLDT